MILSELNCDVDLFFTAKAPPDEEALRRLGELVRRLRWGLRTRRWRDQASLRPFQVVSRQWLERVEFDGSGYDCAILEGDYVAQALRNPTLRTRRLVWRVNNRESGYFFDLARSARGPARAYYALEAAKFAVWRTGASQRPEIEWWFASRDEWQAAGRRRLRGRWLPPAMPVERMEAAPRGGGGALFLGSLFMPNNQDGLEWYLRRVHPLLCAPDYGLTIAGGARGKPLSRLRALASTWTNVRWREDPTEEEAARLYGEAAVFINPMRHGGGLALKTVHALCAGLPVVTTPVGARGCGLRDGEEFSVARGAREFAAAVRGCLEAPERAAEQVRRAQRSIAANFDQRRNLRAALAETPAEPPPG